MRCWLVQLAVKQYLEMIPFERIDLVQIQHKTFDGILTNY